MPAITQPQHWHHLSGLDPALLIGRSLRRARVLIRRYPRAFTFYVSHPIRSIRASSFNHLPRALLSGG